MGRAAGRLRQTRGRAAQRLKAQPVLLTDGGVYDNLAVEPVWKTYKTLLVSDAGRPFESVPTKRSGIITRLKRVADISMEQVAAVRKRWLVDDFVTKQAERRHLDAAYAAGGLPARGRPRVWIRRPEATPPGQDRSRRFTTSEIACLENHGYSLADAALRSRARALCPNLAAPFRWPHEAWCGDGKLSEALTASHRRRILRDVSRYLTGCMPR